MSQFKWQDILIANLKKVAHYQDIKTFEINVKIVEQSCMYGYMDQDEVDYFLLKLETFMNSFHNKYPFHTDFGKVLGANYYFDLLNQLYQYISVCAVTEKYHFLNIYLRNMYVYGDIYIDGLELLSTSKSLWYLQSIMYWKKSLSQMDLNISDTVKNLAHEVTNRIIQMTIKKIESRSSEVTNVLRASISDENQ